MNDRLKEFIEAAQADPELRGELANMGVEDFVAAARERGFELSEEDFKPAAGELSEEDLGNVAGGASCICGYSGSGSQFSCTCEGTGMGGGDHWYNASCCCLVVGTGE